MLVSTCSKTEKEHIPTLPDSVLFPSFFFPPCARISRECCFPTHSCSRGHLSLPFWLHSNTYNLSRSIQKD